MPTPIRVMNWNIEKLSLNKVQLPGIAAAMAKVIVNSDADIVLILELVKNDAEQIMTMLSKACNARAGGNLYTCWLTTDTTGNERYAILVKDLNTIRPLKMNNAADGTAASPLASLQGKQFDVWPVDFPTAPTYPLPAPRPYVPLTTIWITEPLARAAKKQKMAGQKVAGATYTFGFGMRLPAMAIFKIVVPGATVFLPIVMCHFAAVRSSAQRNHLAQGMTQQFKWLEIAQKYDNTDPNAANRASGSICVGGAAQNVREVCFTGDWNIDFLNNDAVGNKQTVLNHEALSALTPTVGFEGSDTPAATPPVNIVPGTPCAAPPAGGPPVRDKDEARNQSLKAAVTNAGTIMYKVEFAPEQMPPWADSAFDNFFYGGTYLSTAFIPPNEPDSGKIVQLPEWLVNTRPLANADQINIADAARRFAQDNVKFGRYTGSLSIPRRVITPMARLAGARLISDHLPVMLRFDI